jgi:hypothetical protein
MKQVKSMPKTRNPYKPLAQMLNLVYPKNQSLNPAPRQRHINTNPTSLLLLKFILKRIIFRAIRTQIISKPFANCNMIITHI